MDTFSHSLWGGGLFGFRGHFWWALFFGAFPDLVSTGVWIAIKIVTASFVFGVPDVASVPDWVFFNYNMAHSFVVVIPVIAITALWRRDIAFAMLAWPLHICLDFPFHSSDFFPTLIAWPLSDIHFDGVLWSSPWVWFPNIAGLIVLFLWRRHQKRSKKQRSSVVPTPRARSGVN